MWLTLIVIGVILAIVGVAVEAAKFLIWVGVILLVVSVVMSLLGRGKNRV